MIRTILIFIYLFISVIIASIVGLLLNVLCSFGLWKYRPYVNYRIAQVWARVLIKVTGCRMTVNGRENIPKKGGLCFVSNHGSIFDIVLILAYAGRPLGFIAKRELIYIPLINIWIPLLGGLYIDRDNLRKGLKTIKRGISNIESGGVMVVFPEGHRSRGQGLLPFRPGSLKLA
ncbi:MAG: 1-acyl-sn-glycerol-3-phosphate acyltransferase, partial [Treponema sp.]|nr:1-acyl-sn-glycerol-3-phosphate acyltransferase [Treponema sp.]